MPDDAPRYQVGNIGEGATVLQGEYLYNIAVQIQDPKDAVALIHQLRQLGEPVYYGPLLRRLDPIVLVNRSESLAEIAKFFADPGVSMLYIMGLPAVGKSTLVRGAIELRRVDTPAVWVTCEGLDSEQLLSEINVGLHLDAQAILGNSNTRLATKIAAVLGMVQHPSILVLDGFEALLDAEDRLSSTRMAEIMEALATLEHKVKVLVTTRRLPCDVGEGSAGIQIMRLGGLSEPMAEMLLQTRAGLAPHPGQSLIPKEVLQKLDGHPKFIELLASAIAELPTEQVVSGLLNASDIGAFVIGQVFTQMDEAELQVLRAALVFRGVFTFDALNSVYSALKNEANKIIPLVRSLARRAVLDIVPGPPVAYYLHPILRDAVPREAGQEAAAHAGAAGWFLQKPFNPADLTTWDDALYHLRRAAEVGRNDTYYQPYKNFIFEKSQELSYSGWGRRLVSEYKSLDTLAENGGDRLLINWALGLELWELNEYDQALIIFRELDEAVTEAQQQARAEDAQGLVDFLVLNKAKLGDVLVRQGKYDEARRMADEIAPIAEANGSVHLKLRHRELRFQIARKSEQPPEMLRWATQCLQLAEQWVQQDPSPQTQDALAEAHFSMGISYLNLGQPEEMFNHLAMQLRIKIEIGKIPGVAAGLFNLGALLAQTDPIRAGALLLTSQQIDLEVSTVQPAWHNELIQSAIPHLFSDPQNIELGLKDVMVISEKLLPFYRRGLERLGNAVQNAGN